MKCCTKYTERNHPKEYSNGPCRLKPVLILCIWWDFCEDDMLPWVLSSILIQRYLQRVCCHVYVVSIYCEVSLHISVVFFAARSCFLSDRSNTPISVPDRRRRIVPEVVLVRRWVIGVLGIWRGEGLGISVLSGKNL